MKEIRVQEKVIAEDRRPFVIADAGVNYYDIARKNGIDPIEAAKLMIREAARAGADAIKFQTYKAEKIASKFSPAYWDTSKETTKSQFELFKKFDMFDEEDYEELARYAEKNNIIFMSTPFDHDAVEFLDKLMPAFKISSSDITNVPMIKLIAQKGKPIFLSTGASDIHEIGDAVRTIENEGNDKIVVMHCILNYPTKYEDANLGMIKHLKTLFPKYLVGYSDHTAPDKNMTVITTAIMLGAMVIEKHFTLDKTLPGNDHYHAMDPDDLRKIVENINLLEKIIGKETKTRIGSEEISKAYARRSIVAKIDIAKDAIIEENMLICKRPGTGINPKFLDRVIGKRAKRGIKEDEILKMEDLY
jgi:N-acetylneuraminate synthase